MNELEKELLAGLAQGAVYIYLPNGIKLSGVIMAHDDVCIHLERNGVSQIVYKRNISTILPSDAESPVKKTYEDVVPDFLRTTIKRRM